MSSVLRITHLIPHGISFNPLVALEQLDSDCWSNLKDDEFDVEFFL